MSGGVSRHALPGFRISLSYAVIYLLLLVLIPLAACLIKAFSLGPENSSRLPGPREPDQRTP